MAVKHLSNEDLDALGEILGIAKDSDWTRVWARDTKMLIMIDYLRHAVRREEERENGE